MSECCNNNPKSNASCSCLKENNKLVFACSGSSNVGQIANEIAKQLTNECFADMSCGVALGADSSGFILSSKNAVNNILIDGCPVGCLKKIFNRHKIVNYDHYIITEMGVEKNSNLNVDENNILIKNIIKIIKTNVK